VVLALVLTGVVPLLSAMGLADLIMRRFSTMAFQPEFGANLDRSLEVYADLVKAMKQSMNHEGALIAMDPAIRQAALEEDADATEAALRSALGRHPTVLSLGVEGEEGPLATVERARPLDPATERAFTVHKPLGGEEGPMLTAAFAADARRLAEMEGAQEFAQGWKAFAERHRDRWVVRPYIATFATIFGLTVLLAVIVGVIVVRPVTRRINQLAAATEPVAGGDLSVRVDDSGKDEIAALARAFNDMLETMGHSRARIEFLKRVGEWQHMARRLAHEIKNPLTPIQLAVEECHQRYRGEDAGYQKLLDTTRDIVVEEVASLRRLVTEFSAFARLPQAELAKGDLAAFLAEQEPRLAHEIDESTTLRFTIEAEEIPVAFDRTLLYRVLHNLVANAAQASDSGEPTVEMRARIDGTRAVITVDDDGPGIEPERRNSVFDPYVTTKADGTGLGLTIVKKIIIDHGGVIDVATSPLGGARFRIELPLVGTGASEAALARAAA
jgi:two-component system, NtrC family, nitrogen regulation sensor histidine kinase NtrY